MEIIKPILESVVKSVVIANTIGKGGGSSGPIGAPSNLAVVVISDIRVDATCTINATNADGVSWEYSSDTGAHWSVHGTSIAGSYSYISLTAGTLYSFRARNYKGTLFSAYCATVSLYTLDLNTKAFSDIATITDATQLNALNNLVIDLKAINVLQANFVNFVTPASSIMKAIYPFIGGTAAKHKFNLIDPRDADAAFRLTFSGTITHDSTGAKPNGIDGYANTYLNPTGIITLNSASLAYYSLDESATSAFDMGCYVSSTRCLDLTLKFTGVGAASRIHRTNTAGAVIYNQTSLGERGLFIGNRISNVRHDFYRGHENFASNTLTQTGTLANINIFLFALNNAGTAAYFTDRKCCYAHISSGIADVAIQAYIKAVQDYNTRLGRGDIYVPLMATTGSPAAGVRVKANLAGWNAAIYHSLYLPTNYSTDRTWPVIIDLPGNTSAAYWGNGLPESMYLGYGLSKGQDFIWVVAPFINTDKTAMAPIWWYDGSGAWGVPFDNTTDYWDALITDLVTNYHADINKIILSGFSRGAVALNYIGCHNDAYAAKWLSWIGHSHWDGGSYTPTGASTRIARMLGKKCMVTYGDPVLDQGYANSQAGLALIQAAGVTEEHYGVTMGHDIGHCLAVDNATIDSMRAFLAQYK